MAEAKYAAGEFQYSIPHSEAKWQRQSNDLLFVWTSQNKISLVSSSLTSTSKSTKTQITP